MENMRSLRRAASPPRCRTFAAKTLIFSAPARRRSPRSAMEVGYPARSAQTGSSLPTGQPVAAAIPPRRGDMPLPATGYAPRAFQAAEELDGFCQ
jgi:hypothetical protein